MQDYKPDPIRCWPGHPWPLHDSPLQTEQPRRWNRSQSKERASRFLMASVPGPKYDFIPHRHPRQFPRWVCNQLYEGHEQLALRKMPRIQERPARSERTQHNGSSRHHWTISNLRRHNSIWSSKSWPRIWRPKDSRNLEDTRPSNWKNALEPREGVWEWGWTWRDGR